MHPGRRKQNCRGSYTPRKSNYKISHIIIEASHQYSMKIEEGWAELRMWDQKGWRNLHVNTASAFTRCSLLDLVISNFTDSIPRASVGIFFQISVVNQIFEIAVRKLNLATSKLRRVIFTWNSRAGWYASEEVSGVGKDTVQTGLRRQDQDVLFQTSHKTSSEHRLACIFPFFKKS